jgi:phosphoglycolate phosphatase
MSERAAALRVSELHIITTMMFLSPAAAVLLLLPTALCFTSSPTSRNSVGNTVGLDNYSVNENASSTSSLIPELNDASRSISSNEQLLPSSPFGVIFDMDGTLIKHSINFAEMRQRIYEVVDADPIGKDLEKDCVLEMPQRLTEEGQRKCHEVFLDIEQRAVDNMQLQDGGAELVQFLIESGLKTAVLTRNMEKNVAHMMELYKNEMSINDDDVTIFDPIVARNTKANPDDDEPLKSKPNPDGILHICKLWGCEPSEVIFVGDSANDDMSAANRAGCGGAVLLQPGGCQLDTDSGYAVGDTEAEIMERTPSLCVESLSELKLCIESVLDEQEKNGVVQAEESASKASQLSSSRRSSSSFTAVATNLVTRLVGKESRSNDEISPTLTHAHHAEGEVVYPIVGSCLVEGRALPSADQVTACNLPLVAPEEEEVFGFWTSAQGADSLWM